MVEIIRDLAMIPCKRKRIKTSGIPEVFKISDLNLQVLGSYPAFNF